LRRFVSLLLQRTSKWGHTCPSFHECKAGAVTFLPERACFQSFTGWAAKLIEIE
jgi:hypothetical protein